MSHQHKPVKEIPLSVVNGDVTVIQLNCSSIIAMRGRQSDIVWFSSFSITEMIGFFPSKSSFCFPIIGIKTRLFHFLPATPRRSLHLPFILQLFVLLTFPSFTVLPSRSTSPVLQSAVLQSQTREITKEMHFFFSKSDWFLKEKPAHRVELLEKRMNPF